MFSVAIFQRGVLFGSLRGASSELRAAVSICGGLPAWEQKQATVRVLHYTQCFAA